MLELFKQVPKVEVRSNELELTIVAPDTIEETLARTVRWAGKKQSRAQTATNGEAVTAAEDDGSRRAKRRARRQARKSAVSPHSPAPMAPRTPARRRAANASV